MRIAIIGSGISGLATAYGLNRHHDITIFEAEPRLGGHTHTVDVTLGQQQFAVDTGFIVYNDRTYPNFIRLLQQLGIEGRRTDMSFSVSDGRNEYASHGAIGFFARRRNLVAARHWRLLSEILRFNRLAPALAGTDDQRTIAEFLASEGFSDDFGDTYIYPLTAAIWSSSLADARLFPAEHFVRFFHNHGLLSLTEKPQWRTVPGGSSHYVDTLAPKLDASIRTSTPVRRVNRDPTGVTVTTDSETLRFDQVVFACHSDQALRLLADPTEREHAILGGLPYTDNDVVLHFDQRLLPRRRRAWASWNYRLHEDAQKPAAITYHMNRLQGLNAPVELCVTLNQTDAINPDAVLGEYRYAHPVYTPQSNRVRTRRHEISGHNRSHYCGAYWYNGFHEDGARSALDVARALGGGW